MIRLMLITLFLCNTPIYGATKKLSDTPTGKEDSRIQGLPKSFNEVVLLKGSTSTLTLADIVQGMDIKPSHFKTDLIMPTYEQMSDRKVTSLPIILWRNPQTINFPNTPLNRIIEVKEPPVK